MVDFLVVLLSRLGVEKTIHSLRTSSDHGAQRAVGLRPPTAAETSRSSHTEMLKRSEDSLAGYPQRVG